MNIRFTQADLNTAAIIAVAACACAAAAAANAAA